MSQTNQPTYPCMLMRIFTACLMRYFTCAVFFTIRTARDEYSSQNALNLRLIWVYAEYNNYYQASAHLTFTSYVSPSRPASVAQLDAPSDRRPGGRGFNPRRGRQHSFVKIDHEIFSTVILSLPLIQEEQLSVSGEKMCTILVNRLED